MKVVLLSLSGDLDYARRALRSLYPDDELAEMRRAEVEGVSFQKRLVRLRALRPDVFAVFTERLAWQRGQNALSLFGALAGAKTILLFDSHGGVKRASRSDVLVRAPLRLMHEASLSAGIIARSWRRLGELERDVEKEVARGPRSRAAQSFAEREPLSIAFLRATPGAGTQFGGASSHINGFINAAIAQGAKIRVISNDRIAGLDETMASLTVIEPEPVGTTRAAFDLYNNLLFTHGAVSEMENDRPDFIYQRYSRFTWAGIEAGLRTKRPLFLEYNGSEVWVGRHWDAAGMFPLLERVERLNLKAAARIFVVSEVERRNLLRAGVADEKIVVNLNGVDVEKFRPGIHDSSAIRNDYGVAVDETLVGFVGTFGPWHGVLELAKAVTLIPASERVRFLLIGAGKLREEAERVVREGGVAERVIFAGVIEHERVPEYLDACDVLVSPHVPLADGSEFFGSPTKLFEYMAMGKGIVASRLGQIGDVLANEETALLVEPGDVEQLSAAIQRLASSRELRERLGKSARARAVEHHTWIHNAATVLDAYRTWADARLALEGKD